MEFQNIISGRILGEKWEVKERQLANFSIAGSSEPIVMTKNKKMREIIQSYSYKDDHENKNSSFLNIKKYTRKQNIKRPQTK